MSKYFKEIEFEVPKSPGNPSKPATKIVIDEDLMTAAIEDIQEEFDRIKIGVSELTHYAIDNGTFGSPVGNAFKRLKAAPTVENIKSFIELSKQDLGTKAALAFKAILKKTLKEVPNV